MTTNFAQMNDAAFAALLAEASAPDATPERLQALAQTDLPWDAGASASRRRSRLLAAVAGNANTPPDTLITLSAQFPDALMENPVLPLLPLEAPDLTDRLPDETLCQLLRFPHVPPVFVQGAVQKPKSKGQARRQAERHILIAGEADPADAAWEREATDALAALDIAEPEGVWEFVEYHPHLTPFLERVGLAAVHEPEHRDAVKLRRAAARAQRGRKEVVPEMQTPRHGWVSHFRNQPDEAHRLARNPRTPEEMLILLAEFAASAEHDEGVYEYVRATLRAHLGNNPATPLAALRALANEDIHARIAIHPNADQELLRKIAARSHTVEVAEALLGNPNTPPDVARRVGRRIPASRRAPAAADGGTAQWVSRFGRRIRRWHPALNPDGPRLPDEESDGPYTYNIPAYTPKLDHFLVMIGRPYALGTLAQIAREGEWTRRFAAAIHPHATPRIWKYLQNDGSRLVRAAARARLADPARPLLGLPVAARAAKA